MNKTNHPSKYDSSYCERLIAHMAQGFSFDSFAAMIGTGRRVLYKWAKVHAEFAEAKAIGVVKLLLFLEKVALEALQRPAKTFNFPVWKWMMRGVMRQLHMDELADQGASVPFEKYWLEGSTEEQVALHM
jgi:hypothetical protein